MHYLQINASYFLLIVLSFLSPDQGLDDVVKTASAAEIIHQIYVLLRDAVVSSWKAVIVWYLVSNLAASILVLTLELIVFLVVKLQILMLIILLNV